MRGSLSSAHKTDLPNNSLLRAQAVTVRVFSFANDGTQPPVRQLDGDKVCAANNETRHGGNGSTRREAVGVAGWV